MSILVDRDSDSMMLVRQKELFTTDLKVLCKVVTSVELALAEAAEVLSLPVLAIQALLGGLMYLELLDAGKVLLVAEVAVDELEHDGSCLGFWSESRRVEFDRFSSWFRCRTLRVVAVVRRWPQRSLLARRGRGRLRLVLRLDLMLGLGRKRARGPFW